MLRLSSILCPFVAVASLLTLSAHAAGIARSDTAIETPLQTVNLEADGPVIELLTPENGGIYISPIGIEIAFAPKDGTTIDLTTLKVTVVSTTIAGVFELDITEDIINYASEAGIKAPKADIPVGDHVVTIQVADSEKRLSEEQLAITVRQETVLERRARE